MLLDITGQPRAPRPSKHVSAPDRFAAVRALCHPCHIMRVDRDANACGLTTVLHTGLLTPVLDHGPEGT